MNIDAMRKYFLADGSPNPFGQTPEAINRNRAQWELGPQPSRTLPGPSFDELAEIAGQCSQGEWNELVHKQEFIDATFISLAECVRVAELYLGRTFRPIEPKPKTEDKDL